MAFNEYPKHKKGLRKHYHRRLIQYRTLKDSWFLDSYLTAPGRSTATLRTTTRLFSPHVSHFHYITPLGLNLTEQHHKRYLKVHTAKLHSLLSSISPRDYWQRLSQHLHNPHPLHPYSR